MSETTAIDNIEALRGAYVALNRGDVEGMARVFDPEIEWVEPEGYPMPGTRRGKEAVTAYIAGSRDTWAEGACEPVRFFAAGDKVVVFVDVRVRLKDRPDWIEAQLADVYTFREGLAVHVLLFPDRQKAIDWAGVLETI